MTEWICTRLDYLIAPVFTNSLSFLGHPSVVNRGDQKTKPVIGLLAVKATKTSIRAFYAHNSASFVCFPVSDPQCLHLRLSQKYHLSSHLHRLLPPQAYMKYQKLTLSAKFSVLQPCLLMTESRPPPCPDSGKLAQE